MTQNGVEGPQKKMTQKIIPVCGLLCVLCRLVEPHTPAETYVTVSSTSSLIIPAVVPNAQCCVSSIHIILKDYIRSTS